MLLQTACLCVSLAPLAAQPRGTRPLIEQALDEPAKITFENVTLADALELITEQTGVRVVMPPAVMRLAPRGGQTPITKVDIANLSLREGLDRLFSPLAMTCVVLDDRVEVVPQPVLRNLARAPTWAELETLSWLASIEPGADPEALAALEDRVQMLVPSPEAWEMLSASIENVGAGPGENVLTAAANAVGWGWTLSDRTIVVGTHEQLIRRRLQRPIFVRMSNRTLFEAMQAVGDAVGVRVQVEPGALAALPAQVQKNFSLDVRNKPAEQALDELAAYTGLGYVIEPAGVLFYCAGNPASVSREAAGSAATPGSDPYVAKISIPLGDGRTLDWLIRRSELPQDLLDMRDRDVAEAFDSARRASDAVGSAREPGKGGTTP